MRVTKNCVAHPENIKVEITLTMDSAERNKFAWGGVSDSIVVFDDTFIPKESVFMCGEWEAGRRLVENVAASPMGAWYQIAGGHGGGSPIMETITLNVEYDYES